MLGPPTKHRVTIASGCAGARADYRLVLVLVDGERAPREVAIERLETTPTPERSE